MRGPVIVGVLALAIGGTACSVPTDTDPNIAAPPAASGAPESAGTAGGNTTKKDDGLHTVIYKVGGSTGRGSITYTTPSGQEQDTNARVPWTKKFKAGDAEFLSVTAQNGAAGTIECSISVDGKTVKRGKSSGAYAVVSCDGSIGF